MGDERLREFERRWRATGTVEDEAAYLSAQVRSGLLLASRLRLSVALGHPAALVACDTPPALERLLCDRCFEISEFGREASVRAAVAAGTLLLARWSPPAPGPQPTAALHALEAWLLCPCPDHQATCREESERLSHEIVSRHGEQDLGFLIHETDASRPHSAISEAALLASRAPLDDTSRRAAVRVVTDIEQTLADQDALWEAIRAEVIEWALGRRDAVRERVDARHGLAQDYVTFFGQRMTRDWAAALERAQDQLTYREGGTTYSRIHYGAETFRDVSDAEQGPCRHCMTRLGRLHDPGCEYEQCPACNGQVTSCDCELEGHETDD